MLHHPIIVIEGPDAVGKTTWARRYCENHGARYLHLTLRQSMFKHQVMSLAIAMRWSRRTPVLIDRHWPSEQLYASAYRGGSPLATEAAKLDEIMMALGVTYVVALLATPEKTFDSQRRMHAERHEMYEPDERYRDLVHAYFDWWHGTSYTQTHLGYCEILRGFGNARPLMSHLYDYETMGASVADLDRHIQDVHEFAFAACDAAEDSTLCHDLLEDRGFFLTHCGLNSSEIR